MTHTPTILIKSSSKRPKLELSKAKISRLLNEVFLNLWSGDVLQAQQHILINNKRKFFSTLKESDYLKLHLTHVKTMMKIHLEGMLKQEETQVHVELENERVQHKKVKSVLNKINLVCLLELEDSQAFNFKKLGSDSSHLSPNCVKANIVKHSFVFQNVCPDMAHENALSHPSCQTFWPCSQRKSKLWE